MLETKRSDDNPILKPNPSHAWEALAAFNPSVIRDGKTFHMVYRAISATTNVWGARINQSTIGYASGTSATSFGTTRQLITSDAEYDRFGCEDPRLTKLGDDYFIFYTGISNWPPGPGGIKIAVAKSKDLKTITEKHLVTPFNAKACGLFPEKVNGKYTLILTPNTDMPPSYIAIAQFDKEEDMWNETLWTEWYKHLPLHTVPIRKTDKDQLEVGGVPVKTREGWLLVYAHIQNYFAKPTVFRIDAVLLDGDNPKKVIGQTVSPIIIPEAEYELNGMVPNVIFPSGAMVEGDDLLVYYGAADTTSCVVSVPLASVMAEVTGVGSHVVKKDELTPKMDRYEGNPILVPVAEHRWESKFTFNPGAIEIEGNVHLLYRAMGPDNISALGYALSKDGLKIAERLPDAVYQAREVFELNKDGVNYGCEDPRLTLMGDTIYMLYTAYDGHTNPRVAMTHIKVADFVARKWELWSKPILISVPNIDDKDACILPETINGQYVFFHRINPHIWVDFFPDLRFPKGSYLGGRVIFTPRVNSWYSDKLGIAGVPHKTDDGWLMIFHGISKYDNKYRLGAALLALDNPAKVIARLHDPILEPEMHYEHHGLRPGTVFSNGSVIKDGMLYVYYGAADTYTAVATMPLKKILDALKRKK